MRLLATGLFMNINNTNWPAVLLEGNLQLLAGLVLVQDGELVDVGNPGACNEFDSQLFL